MHFENEVDIAAAPARVLEVLADPRAVAGFLPGAAVGEPDEAGNHPATLTVAFGPKRITFKGSLSHTCDRAAMTGKVSGRASADLRGAKMSVEMTWGLSPTAAGTRVALVSDAVLTGMLAEFARTGGLVVTRALLDDFAQRLGAHFAKESVPAPGAAPSPEVDGRPASPPPSLSFFSLLKKVLASAFRRRRTSP